MKKAWTTTTLLATLLAPAAAHAYNAISPGLMCARDTVTGAADDSTHAMGAASFVNGAAYFVTVWCPIWWNTGSVDPGVVTVTFHDYNTGAGTNSNVNCFARLVTASGTVYTSSTSSSTGGQALGSPPQQMNLDTTVVGSPFPAGSITSTSSWGIMCTLPAVEGGSGLSAIDMYQSTQT